MTDNSRAYLATHPWLTFVLDVRRIQPSLWMLLGEAASKCEHIAGVPLPPALQDHLHQVYLAKGVLATTAIEGNTLSEEQVRAHLEGKLQLPKSKEYLRQEITNILEACNDLADRIFRGESEITVENILSFNRRVLDRIPVADPEIVPGQIRKRAVGVGRYPGPPPGDCAFLLGRLCEELAALSKSVPDGPPVAWAILRAIFAHIYLVWIHPFYDGNGRTARLMELQILIAAGVPTPAAHLLSNHYNETRLEYYRQLDAASKTGGDLTPFVGYAVQGFVDGLKSQLSNVREHQLAVSWRDFVNAHFYGKSRSPDQRQRQLALDLSLNQEAVPLDQLAMLTPELARKYAQRGAKTLTRDVAALVEAGIVERTERGVRARRELIHAFLPRRKSPSV